MSRGVIESAGVIGSRPVTGSPAVTGRVTVTLSNGVKVALAPDGRITWASDWSSAWCWPDVRHVNLGPSTYGHVNYYYTGGR